MDAQAPMPKRLRIIFRVLAALTLLEGLVGLYGVALDISRVPFVMEYAHKMYHSYAHSRLLLFLRQEILRLACKCLLTAFPVAAGVLIFLAYRYWGIPARPLQ